MRVLLIEDDNDLADVIQRLLVQNGYAIDRSKNQRNGYQLAVDSEYDLIIIDRMLPDGDGAKLCSELRAEGKTTPVLILTTLNTSFHKVEGLDAGADDYMTKPFDTKELLARVRALIRRGSFQPTPQIQIADLVVDPAGRTATRSGNKVELSAKEFSMLEYMALNKGRVLTRAMIAEHVWDMHFDPRSNVIDSYVSILRKKIDKGSNRPLIHTVKGAGYKLTDEP